MCNEEYCTKYIHGTHKNHATTSLLIHKYNTCVTSAATAAAENGKNSCPPHASPSDALHNTPAIAGPAARTKAAMVCPTPLTAPMESRGATTLTITMHAVNVVQPANALHPARSGGVGWCAHLHASTDHTPSTCCNHGHQLLHMVMCQQTGKGCKGRHENSRNQPQAHARDHTKQTL